MKTQDGRKNNGGKRKGAGHPFKNPQEKKLLISFWLEKKYVDANSGVVNCKEICKKELKKGFCVCLKTLR